MTQISAAHGKHIHWATRSFAALCLLVITSCGAGAETTAAAEAGASSSAAGGAMTPGATGPGATDSTPRPAWQTSMITDISGTTFRIADLAGKPVFVEFFATWCVNCRAQLGKTNAAAATAGEEAVFLALSVETELGAADVAKYQADNDFGSIRFAVLSPEMLAQVVEALGNTAVNPPATPHLVVGAQGKTGELVTGFEDPDAIIASLSQA